jgi:hypothetical protein
MNVAVIRRYLQPSPTLRWHPWAPLIAGILLLLFVFYFGARWGYDAARRERAWEAYSPAFTVQMSYLADNKSPGKRLLMDASRIDYAVRRFVDYPARAPNQAQQWRDRIEAFALRNGFTPLPTKREDIVRLAEFRLRELSPSSARWQATSAYCGDTREWRFAEEDVLRYFIDVARAYSTLLGREIRPEDLAPAVSGWKCPANSKGQQP